MKSLLYRVVLVVLCLTLATGVQTALGSTAFNIGSNHSPQSGGDIGTPAGNYWQLGTGWGTSSGQLDAVFKLNSNLNSPCQLPFTLDVGQCFTWKFGSVELKESDISSSETNNLQVTGWVDFLLPPVGDVPNSTIGVAICGSVSDWATDLKIDFCPVTVPFGECGEFCLDLSDLCFNRCEKLYVDATVCLKKDDCLTPGPTVPEPATFVIWSLLGGIGLAVGCWRRKRTAA